jgi:mannosyl-oligosaccharide alpha-1,2-mannosidase
MLPTHHNTRNGLISNSSAAVLTAKLYLNKPFSRWLFLCIAFAGSLWFLGPWVLHIGSDVHHRPHRPIFNEHDRRPPRPGSRPPARPRPPHHTGSPTLWSTRAEHVRNAYIHAWEGYQSLAAPYDELLPVSSGKVNKYVARSLLFVEIQIAK